MINRFSYSSLETYRKCSHRFKLRYLDKIQKPDEGIEAFMGKRVHEALEFLYNEVLAGRFVLFDSVIDFYRLNWRQKWHDRIAIVRSEHSSEDYYSLGENCLAWYYRTYHPFEQSVVGNEIVLEFSLDGDRNYRLKGIVDRLDHDGNGHWEIHDYKTGKRAFTQNQADRDGQLALYQLALKQKERDVRRVTLVWHFVQRRVEVRSSRNAQQLRALIQRTRATIDEIRLKIENAGSFPPRETILCNWCYFWEECPVKRGTNPYFC